MNKLALVLLLIAFGSARDCMAEDNLSTVVSPKLSLRTSFGSLSNSGTLGGNLTSIGAFNLVYIHGLTDRLFVGVGYRADFDIVKLSMPVRGFDLFGRYYFYGTGTRRIVTIGKQKFIKKDPNSFYAGGELAERSYFLPKVQTSGSTFENLSGTFGSLNVQLGWDHTVTTSFEWNNEILVSALTFSQTDSRVRMASYMFNTGITYIFN